MTDFTLRRSTPDDAADVAAIWHQGWHQAHVGHVPEGLTAARTLAASHERASLLVAGTTVALADGAVVGFVMVFDDEVEQLFVTPWARGTGLAVQLLTEGEQQVQTAGHSARMAGRSRRQCAGPQVLRALRLGRRGGPGLRSGGRRGDVHLPVSPLQQTARLNPVGSGLGSGRQFWWNH